MRTRVRALLRLGSVDGRGAGRIGLELLHLRREKVAPRAAQHGDRDGPFVPHLGEGKTRTPLRANDSAASGVFAPAVAPLTANLYASWPASA